MNEDKPIEPGDLIWCTSRAQMAMYLGVLDSKGAFHQDTCHHLFMFGSARGRQGFKIGRFYTLAAWRRI